MHGNCISKINFFTDKSKQLIANLVPKLVPLFKKKDEMIYLNQDVASEIYFICKGRVNLITTKLKIPYKTYITGSYFGEIEIIFKRNRTTNVMAEIDCDMLWLSKKYMD